MKDWADEFSSRRFSDRFHLGGGDIRITMADQDELAALTARLAALEGAIARRGNLHPEQWREILAAEVGTLKARLAEATELVRDALRYPHKPGSKHSTWDNRAFAFLRDTDSANSRDGTAI